MGSKEYPELNSRQCERVDEVENAVFDLCRILTEKEDLEWDASFIGEIADCACGILSDHGFKVRYPAIVEENDEYHIEEYYS